MGGVAQQHQAAALPDRSRPVEQAVPVIAVGGATSRVGGQPVKASSTSRAGTSRAGSGGVAAAVTATMLIRSPSSG